MINLIKENINIFLLALSILLLVLLIFIRDRIPQVKLRKRNRVIRSGRYGWIEEIEKTGPVLMHRKDTK